MKKTLSLTLIISLLLPYIIALKPSNAFELEVNQSSDVLLARGRRGGGGRSRGGGSRRSINSSGLGARGSGRIQRSNRTINRPSGNNRPTINRPNNNNRPVVNRPNNNNRPALNNRPNNNNRPVNRPNRIDRDNNRIDIDSRHRTSNRINRNTIDNRRNIRNNDVNIGNRRNINIGDRNIVVNPRYNGRGSWGWYGGRPWYGDYNYWGGGFWGGFAVGAFTTAVTGAIINSSNDNDTNYVVIEKDTPGYTLFSSYNLVQVQCNTSEDLVFIYGPQDTLMCATPNTYVSSGYYDVDQENLVLVVRD